MYSITRYSYAQAQRLGVRIKPSTVQGKKIDVFRGNNKVASIGDTAYPDYPTYIKTHGLAFAQERRRLYRLRHAENAKVVGSPAYYALQILW
jgi:hypothetical protein